MSLRSKFISVITLGAGIVVFSTGAFAQDTKTTAPSAPAAPAVPQKAERPFRGERHDPGMRKQGGNAFMDARMGPGGRMGGPMGALRGLNLTDAQKAQLKSIHEANRPDKATMDELRTIMQARRDGTITDAQKARAQALRAQAQTKAKSVQDQVQNVLTADQKAQLAKEREEMRNRFQEHRQHGTDKPAATDKPKIN